MGIFACFGGQGTRKGRRSRRKSRRKQKPQGLVINTSHRASGQDLSPSAYGSPRSAFSDEDFFDAHEDPYSSSPLHSSRGSMDGVHSPFGSTNGRLRGDDDDGSESEDEGTGMLTRLSGWLNKLGDKSESSGNQQATPSRTPPPQSRNGAPVIPPDGIILEPDDRARSGCVSIFGAAQSVVASKRFLRLAKPQAGASFSRLGSAVPETGAPAAAAAAAAVAAAPCQACAWEPTDATTFMVRSQDYMRTKIKEGSADSIYRLIGVDMYSFDFKLYHIVQHVELPPAPKLSAAAEALPPGERLPPLLIINLQLPLYTPSVFGGNDGPGHSLVYYFALPEGWDPAQVPNKAALGLAQRFVNNGVEFDGQATRDRFKLIPRIVNIEEWAEHAPLSNTEVRIIRNYNGKPVLTRPQHRYYSHPSGTYLEVDLDVHSYAYIARRGFNSYITRLAMVVFENAFVLQGNRPEELPEVVLGAARVHRVDFTKSRPFPAKSLEEMGHGEHPDPVRNKPPFLLLLLRSLAFVALLTLRVGPSNVKTTSIAMRYLCFALVALLACVALSTAQTPDEESGLRTSLFNFGKKVLPNGQKITKCVRTADCPSGQVCDEASYFCVPCLAPNTGCNATQTCQVDTMNPLNNACVNCLAPAVNCAAGEVCLVDPYVAANNACVECVSSKDCSDDTFCNLLTNTCVQCNRNEECSGDTPFCNLNSNTCVQCTSSVGCATGTTEAVGLPVCNVATSSCVPCLAPNVGCEGALLCDVDSDNQLNNRCVECLSRANCGGTTPACDTAAGVCKQCIDSSTCTGATPQCGSNGVCVQCINDGNCSGFPATPNCDVAAGVCVDCVNDADCAGTPLTPVCSANVCTGGCTDNTQCVGTDLPVCNTSINECVQCTAAADCSTEEVFKVCSTSNSTCVECNVDADCTTSGEVCNTATGLCEAVAAYALGSPCGQTQPDGYVNCPTPYATCTQITTGDGTCYPYGPSCNSVGVCKQNTITYVCLTPANITTLQGCPAA